MDIDVTLVRRLIDQQFPQWRSFPIRPIASGGWDNRTFRLGTDLTVRLPSHVAYAAQVTKEQRWLPQLAARLPVAIPTPVAEGRPSDEYPWYWSVYRWINGETAQVGCIPDRLAFASELAQFLVALQKTNATGGRRRESTISIGAPISMFMTRKPGKRSGHSMVGSIWKPRRLSGTWL